MLSCGIKGAKGLSIVILERKRRGRLTAYYCLGLSSYFFLLRASVVLTSPDDPLVSPEDQSHSKAKKTMSQAAVAVSAPGKVLLAGGYLVLDRKYNGLVFGLDARIHICVKPFASSSGVAFSEITVKSPQFQHAVWEYGYRLAERNGGIRVTQLRA